MELFRIGELLSVLNAHMAIGQWIIQNRKIIALISSNCYNLGEKELMEMGKRSKELHYNHHTSNIWFISVYLPHNLLSTFGYFVFYCISTSFFLAFDIIHILVSIDGRIHVSVNREQNNINKINTKLQKHNNNPTTKTNLSYT